MTKIEQYKAFVSKNETYILFGLHFLFAGSIAFSESLVSIFSGYFVLFVLFSFNYKQRLSRLLQNRTALLFISIYIFYLLGFVFSKHIDLVLYELRKTMFWWIFPLAIASSKRIPRWQFYFILYLFAITVTVSSGISFLNYLKLDNVGVDNFRDISFLSHINFSLLVDFAIFVLIYFFIENYKCYKTWFLIVHIILVCWLLFMLVIIKSLIGILSFQFAFIVGAIWYLRKVNRLQIKRFLQFFVLMLILLPLGYVANITIQFYNVVIPARDTIEWDTALGNKYKHNFSSFQKENGHLVNYFICEKELKEAWNKRSALSYEGKTLNNESLRATLMRYLTSKGLRKDANGVMALSDDDIANIEMGIANYIYADRERILYARIYETIWEIDQYLLTGNPNHKSLAQRIEQVKVSVKIIKKNPWFGVGIGNTLDAGKEVKQLFNSKLDDELIGKAHLQYLSYAIKFGIVGLIYILFAVFYPFIKNNGYRNILFLLLVILFFVANFGDNQWENHIGLSFFCYFYSFFMWGVCEEKTSIAARYKIIAKNSG